MVCKALGLGPQCYCIMQSIHLGFAEQVFLLIQFLLHHKMYLYPNFGLPLRGPFDQSPHTREIREAMCQRIIPFSKLPLICPACDSSFYDHVVRELLEL